MQGSTQFDFGQSPPPNLGVPDVIPVFPLRETVLLPGEILPLHIFEPRYRAMVEDAIATHQVIGMVEPQAGAEPGASAPRLREIGCLGFIAHHQELGDGRHLIWLLGLERFHIDEELETEALYRQVRVTYVPTEESQHELAGVLPLRQELRSLLPQLFTGDEATRREITEQMQQVSDTQLVALAAQMLDLTADRKQEILEASSLATRLVMLYEDLFTTLEVTAGAPEPSPAQLN